MHDQYWTAGATQVHAKPRLGDQIWRTSASDPRTMGRIVFSLLGIFAILLPAKASFDYAAPGTVAKSRMKRGELICSILQ